MSKRKPLDREKVTLIGFGNEKRFDAGIAIEAIGSLVMATGAFGVLIGQIIKDRSFRVYKPTDNSTLETVRYMSDDVTSRVKTDE